MSKKVKILLVDDSDVMLRHVSSLLSNRGFHVIPVLTMPKALEAYMRSKPDAILADFILEGGTTGLLTIEAIFALAAQSGMPKPAAAIITLGGLSDPDQVKAASHSIPIIQKPNRGKENEFLQNIEFWLHDSKLIG